MSAMIEIEGLTKRFGPVLAVDDISMTVERGEVLGFLGPNGAGKSTTMKMVTGYLAPTAGSARVMGHDVATAPLAVKGSLGYLPEGAPAYGDMTARAFLNFIGEVRGFDRAERKRRIDHVTETVDLYAVIDRPVETLSKGYKRRVGLAQAILHDPEVLIMDEPTDGLDPNQKHQVRTLIQKMAAEKAIVISTHILEEVEAVCTRAVVIAHGRLLADGTPQDLIARARNHNTVVIRLPKGSAPAPIEDIKKIDGVADVRTLVRDGEAAEYRVTPQGGASIALPVADLLRAKGVAPDELYVEKGALDQVFRDITTNDNLNPGEAAE